MSRLVAHRFEVRLTLLGLDDWNEPVNEYPQEPVLVYGIKNMRDWLEALPAQIEIAERELAPKRPEEVRSNGDVGQG